MAGVARKVECCLGVGRMIGCRINRLIRYAVPKSALAIAGLQLQLLPLLLEFSAKF